MSEPICVGVVVGAQGLRGAVRIKPFTAEPGAIGDYGPVADEAGRRFGLTVTGLAKGVVTATLEGVADRDAAEALRGTRLYVPRAALPAPEEEAFYHADLIGLRAETPEGGVLGTVRAVYDFGAGDVIELALEQGGTVMVPFTRAAVPVVEVAAGRIIVDPPAGLLERVEEDRAR